MEEIVAIREFWFCAKFSSLELKLISTANGISRHFLANTEKEATLTLTKQANEEVKNVMDSDVKPTRPRVDTYNGNAKAD